jgi:hypothetical protein
MAGFEVTTKAQTSARKPTSNVKLDFVPFAQLMSDLVSDLTRMPGID